MTAYTKTYSVDDLRHVWRQWARSNKHEAIRARIAVAIVESLEVEHLFSGFSGPLMYEVAIECTDRRQARMVNTLVDHELQPKSEVSS